MLINPNWPSQFTYFGRYEDTGITDRIFEYIAHTGKNTLNILDVGCSAALATKSLQNNLSLSNIHAKTTGVDISSKIQESANKNLDKFILGDILDINLLPEFDIVICSKMVLFESATRKAAVLAKCSKLMKPDGGLVTDAQSFDLPKIWLLIKENVTDFKRLLWKLQLGPKIFYQEWKKIIEFRLKRKSLLIIGNISALQYSEKILHDWKKLTYDQKFSFFLDIITAKLMAYVNRNPNYKKNVGKTSN